MVGAFDAVMGFVLHVFPIDFARWTAGNDARGRCGMGRSIDLLESVLVSSSVKERLDRSDVPAEK